MKTEIMLGFFQHLVFDKYSSSSMDCCNRAAELRTIPVLLRK